MAGYEKLEKNGTIAFGIGLLVFFASAYIHQAPAKCPTPLSRLDLLHAVLNGAVTIDAYHTNTPDKAIFAGHYYSDKAPGTAFLALPAFTAAAAILKIRDVPLETPRGWLFSSWVACVGSIGIVSALGAALYFNWLSKRAAPWSCLAVTLALFLGAAPLPYATMMFSHSLVIGLLCIALWSFDRQMESSEPGMAQPGGGMPVAPPHAFFRPGRVVGTFRENKWDAVAGLALGFALASEYTSGLVVVGMVVSLVAPNYRRLRVIGASGLGPLLLIPLYSLVCFGDPLVLPYSLQASFPQMQRGLYAIRWPDLNTAWNLFFSPTRGLIFWSPFLVLALFGYWRLFRENRRLFWLTYAVPLVHIIVISGRTWDWAAGPSLGPRLLSPILPLLGFPCALGIMRLPIVGILLAGYSILIITGATLTNACPRGAIYNPLIYFHLRLFRNGEFSPNLGLALGCPPYVSVAVFYAIITLAILGLWRALPKDRVGAENQH